MSDPMQLAIALTELQAQYRSDKEREHKFRDELVERIQKRDLALVRISLALGGSDEWTDEETMLSDVVRRAEERG